MKKFSKKVALFTVAAIFCVQGATSAADYDNGYAYEGTHRAATISPWAAAGAVAIVAGIVALCVNDGHHHSHTCHYHAD